MPTHQPLASIRKSETDRVFRIFSPRKRSTAAEFTVDSPAKILLGQKIIHARQTTTAVPSSIDRLGRFLKTDRRKCYDECGDPSKLCSPLRRDSRQRQTRPPGRTRFDRPSCHAIISNRGKRRGQRFWRFLRASERFRKSGGQRWLTRQHGRSIHHYF